MAFNMTSCDISKFHTDAERIVRIIQAASRKMSDETGYAIQDAHFEIVGYEFGDAGTKTVNVDIEPEGEFIKVSGTVTEYIPFVQYVPFEEKMKTDASN